MVAFTLDVLLCWTGSDVSNSNKSSLRLFRGSLCLRRTRSYFVSSNHIRKLQCLYLFIATYSGGPKSLFHNLSWLQHTTFSLKMLCLVHVCTACTRKHSWFCAWLFRQREVQTLLYFQTPHIYRASHCARWI